MQTDDAWASHMRENSSGSYHPSGTCKMGIDPAAVVTPELKVIGVEGLRENAISMTIGEEGADLILKDQNKRPAA